jgi:hypothetical protein
MLASVHARRRLEIGWKISGLLHADNAQVGKMLEVVHRSDVGHVVSVIHAENDSHREKKLHVESALD